LPYIRRFLFPSVVPPPPADCDRDDRKPTCWHYVFDLARLGPATKAGLPLTLRGQDRRKHLSVEHALLLESVQLVVFCYNVAFLVFRYCHTDPEATYFDQMEALNYLRTIAPLYRGFEMPELVTTAARHRVEVLLPYLLAEFAPGAVPALPG